MSELTAMLDEYDQEQELIDEVLRLLEVYIKVDTIYDDPEVYRKAKDLEIERWDQQRMASKEKLFKAQVKLAKFRGAHVER